VLKFFGIIILALSISKPEDIHVCKRVVWKRFLY